MFNHELQHYRHNHDSFIKSAPFNVDFQELKTKLTIIFRKYGFDAVSFRASAITFCNKKGMCYALMQEGTRIRCEVSKWDKRTFTAKSELTYGTAVETQAHILLRLIENDTR